MADIAVSITDGRTKFCANDINPILATITNAINDLSAEFDDVKESVVSEGGSPGLYKLKSICYYDTGFSDSCKRGMIIAKDYDKGIYVPAVAEYSSETNKVSPSAVVSGVLLTDPASDGTGLVLKRGVVKGDDIISMMTGGVGSTVPGDYYLTSDTEAPGTGCIIAEGNTPAKGSCYCFTVLSSTPASPVAIFDPVRQDMDVSDKISEISSNFGLISVSESGGKAEININEDLEPQSVDNTGYAITDITKEGVKTAPVVNSISAGVGITIEQPLDDQNEPIKGSFKISNSQLSGQFHDLVAINLDGVYLSTVSTGAPVYIFPTKVSSSMLGYVRLPVFGKESTDIKCRLVLGFYGNHGQSTLSGVNVINQACYVESDPETGDLTSHLMAKAAEYTIDTIATNDPNKLYLTTIPLSIEEEVGPNSMLTLKIMSSGESAKNVLLAMAAIQLY